MKIGTPALSRKVIRLQNSFTRALVVSCQAGDKRSALGFIGIYMIAVTRRVLLDLPAGYKDAMSR